MLGGLLLLLLLALQAVAADPAARASLQAAARELAAAAAVTPTMTEPGRTIVLHTHFGQIRIRLLEQLAPRITALVRHSGCVVWLLLGKGGNGGQSVHHVGCGGLPLGLRSAAAVLLRWGMPSGFAAKVSG